MNHRNDHGFTLVELFVMLTLVGFCGFVLLLIFNTNFSGFLPTANNLLNTIPPGSDSSAGFWKGLLHGTLSIIFFLWSLFNDTISIYEIHNNGGWYNLGFLLGTGAFIKVLSSYSPYYIRVKI